MKELVNVYKTFLHEDLQREFKDIMDILIRVGSDRSEAIHNTLPLLYILYTDKKIPNREVFSFWKKIASKTVAILTKNTLIRNELDNYKDYVNKEIGCFDNAFGGLFFSIIQGNSFLHEAVNMNDPQLLEEALEREGWLQFLGHKNLLGQTALSLAKDKGHLACVEILERYMNKEK